MPDKELAIVIRAKDRATKVVKGLKGGLKGLKDMAARMKKTLLITMAAAAAGFIALGLAIRKVTKASGIQEDAEKRLQQAMEAVGTFTQKSYRNLLNYASALQEVTRFGDENTISMMANLQTYGMTEKELRKATKATVDLAAAKKMDLTAASELVGKAFVGETGTLSRYGIIIDASIPKTEKFAAVLKLINERFGGAAQAEARTYTGRLIQMGNTWGDIKEVVGDAITKNKTVLDILGRVGNALERAKKYLEDHREELEKYVTKVVEVAEKISKVVFPIIRTAARVFKNATKAIINFFARLTGGSLQLQIDDTRKAIEEINKEIERTKELYRETGKETEDFFGWESNLNEINKKKIELQETLNKLLEEQKKLKKEIVETEEKEVPAGKDSPLVSKTNKEYDFIQARVNVATTQMKHYWDDYFEDVLGMSVDWKMKMKKPISGHRMFVREALEEAKKYWDDYFLRAFGKTAYELDKTKDETKNAFNYMKEMSVEAARSMQRTFSDFFFKGMKREFDSFEDALKSFGDSMLRIWSDYMAKMAAQALLGGTGGGMGGILGSIGGWIGGLFKGEKGGIATGGFKAFQSGGIVREPTFGLVGEGRRDEAIIPLEGGRVPVKFLGEGKGGVTVFQLFNISAVDGPSVERMVQNNKQVFWEVTAQGFSRNSALRQIMKRDG